jgi:hypothetical protein
MAPQGITITPVAHTERQDRERNWRHTKYEFYSAVLSHITGLTFHFHNYEKTLNPMDAKDTLPFITRWECRCGADRPKSPGWMTDFDVNSMYTVRMLKSRHTGIGQWEYDVDTFKKEMECVFDLDTLKDAT